MERLTEQELLWIVVTKLIFDQMPQIIKDILPLKVPMLIWIDPTNMCNFKCVFCPTGMTIAKVLVDQKV